MSMIPFLLDEQAHQLGFQRWLGIDYNISSHVITSGRTGSGKTVCAKLLLARTVLLAPPELQPVEITVIDPKADDDFQFLVGMDNFYRGEQAPQGLSGFHETFRRRQSGENTSRNLKICFIDEHISLVSLIEDKREREMAQRRLLLLAMLSRSFKCSIQLATQQPKPSPILHNPKAIRFQGEYRNRLWRFCIMLSICSQRG